MLVVGDDNGVRAGRIDPINRNLAMDQTIINSEKFNHETSPFLFLFLITIQLVIDEQ